MSADLGLMLFGGLCCDRYSYICPTWWSLSGITTTQLGNVPTLMTLNSGGTVRHFQRPAAPAWTPVWSKCIVTQSSLWFIHNQQGRQSNPLAVLRR